jgi:CPA1 family monovalent cation:H+ antiporter
MLSIFEIASLLVFLSAAFGWVNLRLLKLPHTIGLLVMALGSSVLLLLLDELLPGIGVAEGVKHAVAQIDFYSTIMEGMLALLLFAGALHVDLDLLRNQKWAIGLMASVGVVLSTTIVGGGMWLAARLLGFDLPLAWALVFGALISPTDPVAVLGLLKTIDVPPSIKAKIAGESLFNDGVALVAFSVMVTLALGPPAGAAAQGGLLELGEVLVYAAGGAILFGLATGYVAYRAMLAVDDHVIEILISVAACLATYAISHRLHMSGPIAVVVTGLLIGNHGAEHAMSEKVEEYLFAFWEVIDEILNSLLFLMIGLEVLVISLDLSHALVAAVAIPVVLVARLVSVAVPIKALALLRQTFTPGAVAILTWGGLRGGVSVALALSLPDGPYKTTLLSATYAVVVFSIIVQGLTVRQVVGRSLRSVERDEADATRA